MAPSGPRTKLPAGRFLCARSSDDHRRHRRSRLQQRVDSFPRARRATEGSGALLAEGGARGADKIAGEWADKRGIDHVTYHANWKKLGLAAGPYRNERMLSYARPDLLVAFPGGAGTMNCLELAVQTGVREIVLVDAKGNWRFMTKTERGQQVDAVLRGMIDAARKRTRA